MWARTILSAAALACSGLCFAAPPPALRVGRAGHAFDHLGEFGAQSGAAAASGASIIYATGLGSCGYQGLPAPAAWESQCRATADYNREARGQGIELVIGYLCATSMVDLELFDRYWSDEFRRGFKTSPNLWRQQDRHGKPLASWYGDSYSPACMSNPDWREYQRFMVRQQLETGHDGIFFDNPTVHPQGCYCEYCMAAFHAYLRDRREDLAAKVGGDDLEQMRQCAESNPREFLQFRATIARDFLAEMRRHARTINSAALVTCNNSLNLPDRLYAQSRQYAYNIAELSKAEDFVVVEDMATQPRTSADGRVNEYGPTYRQLHAISRGKPLVAVTIAEGDYHTAPHLVRLAMAEAAAHGASYLSWPTWPENQRQRMIEAIRPQADWLRGHETLLNDRTPRADAVLFLPFQQWVDGDVCKASALAAALSRENIQYRVVSEDGFELGEEMGRLPALLVESRSAIAAPQAGAVAAFEAAGGRVVTADQPNWLTSLKEVIGAPSLTIEAPPTVRAVVYDQPDRTIIHLYNLNVERVSSFEDRVTPATDVRLRVRLPMDSASETLCSTADSRGTSGSLAFKLAQADGQSSVEFTVPRLEISAILTILP
jgi:hypothetical protein